MIVDHLGNYINIKDVIKKKKKKCNEHLIYKLMRSKCFQNDTSSNQMLSQCRKVFGQRSRPDMVNFGTKYRIEMVLSIRRKCLQIVSLR